MWRDIFHKLKDEGTVQISYEASISTELKCMIGDIPVYKFKVQYFKEGVDELITKYADTFEELERIIDSEVAFRRCEYCGHLIIDGFFVNEELDEDYCCVQCMIKRMNDHYGVGNWHFKSPYVSGIFTEDSMINEYQFEVLLERELAEVMDYQKSFGGLERYVRVHVDNKELGKMWNDGSGGEPDEQSSDESEGSVFSDFVFDEENTESGEAEQGEETDNEPSDEIFDIGDSEFEFDEDEPDCEDKIWVPYHMYYCPPLHED